MLHTVHSRGWKGSGRFHLENFRAAAFISLRHLSDELKGLNSTVKEIDLKMPTPEMRQRVHVFHHRDLQASTHQHDQCHQWRVNARASRCKLLLDLTLRVIYCIYHQ